MDAFAEFLISEKFLTKDDVDRIMISRSGREARKGAEISDCVAKEGAPSGEKTCEIEAYDGNATSDPGSIDTSVAPQQFLALGAKRVPDNKIESDDSLLRTLVRSY